MHPAEEHIRQAIERGEFDHLSGKGKPLRWEEYPFEDPDRRLAHHILRNAGFTLPWIEARQGLLTEITQARSVWQSLCDENQTKEQRCEVIQTIKSEIENLNRRIHSYNLQVELTQLQLPCLQFQSELERLNVTDTIP